MTAEEFHTWSQRLQLSKETEALIRVIRSSAPVRRVTGQASNVTGRYPSPKMQCSIRFESQHVESLGDFVQLRPEIGEPLTLPLAQFLEKIATEEQLLLQQQRDLEGRSIREAIVGQLRVARMEPVPQGPEDDEELDLATIPQYEEYR